MPLKYSSMKDVDKMLSEKLEAIVKIPQPSAIWSLREHLKRLRSEVPKVGLPKL